MARKQRTDHAHGGTEANGLGDVAIVTDTAVCDDGFTRCFSAPTDSCKLPTACPETSLELGNADLTGTDADFRCIGAGIFQFTNSFRRSDITSDHKRFWQIVFDMLNHVNDDLGVTVGNVYGHIIWRQIVSSQRFDKIKFFILNANTD